MQQDQLKLAGIVVAVIVGVGLVAAGAMGAGVGPVSDQEPAEAQPTPTETPTPDAGPKTETPGNLGNDVEAFPNPTDVSTTIEVGNGSDGLTNYTVTNNASEPKRLKIKVGLGDGTGLSRVQGYELKPGDSVKVTFKGSANYSLTVNVIGGATETYDVTVDCNQRYTHLAITSKGEIEQGLSASSLMACGPSTDTT